MRELIALFHADPAGDGITWDVGTTEHGDPQFYLLGAAPEHECVLCVSRLAQGYVLEDGEGRLIGEDALARSASPWRPRAPRCAAGDRSSRASRWCVCAIRLTIEEKVEPMFEESQELLVRFVPQIAAFV